MADFARMIDEDYEGAVAFAEKALAALKSVRQSWPQIGTDDEMNGGDVVEWIGKFADDVDSVIALAEGPCFRNDTADAMEISVPITLQASIRFWIDPGVILTADAINHAVGQLAYAAGDDVFRHPKVDGDWSMNVLGVEPGGPIQFYNNEASGEVEVIPAGVEFADFSTTPAGSAMMLSALKSIRDDIEVCGLSDFHSEEKEAGLAGALAEVNAAIAAAEGRADG